MINLLASEIHANVREKGFWDKDRNLGEMLMLIVSEVSEAMEADRKNRFCNTDVPLRHKRDFETTRDFIKWFVDNVKDTFEDELADACIGIFDLAFSRGIDLEYHIKAKMKYNAEREFKHGKKILIMKKIMQMTLHNVGEVAGEKVGFVVLGYNKNSSLKALVENFVNAVIQLKEIDDDGFNLIGSCVISASETIKMLDPELAAGIRKVVIEQLKNKPR